MVGILSVAGGVWILKREFDTAIRSIPTRNLDNTEAIRRELDELNSSFFDIANDLEGKYSVHEKQIRDMEFILEDYTNRQIDKMKHRSVRRTDRSPEALPPFGDSSSPKDVPRQRIQEPVPEIADGAESDEMIPPQAIKREKILFRDACKLLDEGLSMAEAAKVLEIGVGELQLILGMKHDQAGRRRL